jgi:hypothetical protein
MNEIFRIAEACATNRDVSTVTDSYISGRAMNELGSPTDLYVFSRYQWNVM